MTGLLKDVMRQRTVDAAPTAGSDDRLASVRRRVTRLRRRRWAVWAGLALAGVAMLANTGLSLYPGRDVAGPPRTSQQLEDLMRERARAVLARWDAAVAASGSTEFVPVGSPARQIGDWEPELANNKEALMNGRIEATVPLTATAPPNAEVRWADGTTRMLPTTSAASALHALIAADAPAQPCSDCVRLRVTGVRLTAGAVETTRGPATVPVWEFTLAGTAVRLTWPAIDLSRHVTVTPPPWDEFHPPVGVLIMSASGRTDGHDLTVTFIGAVDSSLPCGADYSAEAIESTNAIAIIIHVIKQHPPDHEAACPTIGHQRTAVAHLASPFGDRAVLEITQGMPVPVIRTN